MVLTGGRDKTICLWGARQGRAICEVNMHEDVDDVMCALNGHAIIALVHKKGDSRLAMLRLCGEILFEKD